MRLKAIPGDVVDAVKDNPIMLVGGLAVIGLGAYLYFGSAPNDAPVESYDSSSYLSPYSGFMPISTGINTTGGALDPGAAGGAVVAGDPNAVTTRELFDFEKLKESHDYELSLAQLQQNADISAANAALSMAGIQASMFSSSTSLASSMMANGNTSVLGAFFGPNGEQWSFGLAATNKADSKKNKVNNAIAASNFAGQTALQNFIATMRAYNVPSSGSSATATQSYGGTTNAMLAPSSGSIATATINNGYSSGSAGNAVIANNASTVQITNGGNGSGSVGGNRREFLNTSNALQ